MRGMGWRIMRRATTALSPLLLLVGVAVCVPREGAGAVSEAELAAFLAPKVPRYKMPKRFFFWDALPKSGYGKVPKRLVRDELEARGLLDLTAKQTS